MHKVQVAFDVEPLSLTGPVGRPVLACSVVSNELSQDLVVLAASDIGWHEVHRLTYPKGPLTAHNADVASLVLGDAVWQWLTRYIGIQLDLPVPLE